MHHRDDIIVVAGQPDFEQQWDQDVVNIQQQMIQQSPEPQVERMLVVEEPSNNWIVNLSENFVGGVAGLVGAPVIAGFIIWAIATRSKKALKTWWNKD